jgi:hypothetical protein
MRFARFFPFASFWNARFPGQISDRLVIAEELTGALWTSARGVKR